MRVLLPVLLFATIASCGGSGDDPAEPKRAAAPKYVTLEAPASVSQGQLTSFRARVAMPDTAPYHGRVELALSGVWTRTDTIVVRTDLGYGWVDLEPPRDLNDGPMVAVARALEVANVRPDTVQLRVRDTTEPDVFAYHATLQTSHGQHELELEWNWLVAGDTVSFRLGASDNHRLEWLGYRLGPPADLADSAHPAGSFHGYGDALPTDTARFRFDVSDAWLGERIEPTFFARDANGNETTVDLGPITIISWRERATRSVPLTDSVSDVAFDVNRGVAYLSQKYARRVAVLDLDALTFLDPIDLPAQPAGIDLVPSGDSLVVALWNQPDIAVVDLTTSSRPIDLVRMDVDTNRIAVPNYPGTWLPYWTNDVRVAANGMLVFAIRDAMTYTGREGVMVHDLSTGTTRRFRPREPNSITPAALARSGDRTKVIAVGTYFTGIYSAALDTVTFVEVGGDPPLSVSDDGSVVLARLLLSDGAMGHRRELPYSSTAVSTLTPDGSSVISASWINPDPYSRFRTSDLMLTERTPLPFAPTMLRVTPDGGSLLLITTDAIALMDLH